MEFIFELKEAWKGSPDNNSSKTMTYEGDAFEGVGRKELDNVVFDLGGKTMSHFDDVCIGHILIWRCAVKPGFGIKYWDTILNKFHIKTISLKSMNKDNKM